MGESHGRYLTQSTNKLTLFQASGRCPLPDGGFDDRIAAVRRFNRFYTQ
jgi:hypothetical protein